MSDIQDPLSVLQRRVQQRQILAMMGINQWVQPESQTINVTDIETAVVHQSDSKASRAEQLAVGHRSDEGVNSSTSGNDTTEAKAPTAINLADQPTSGYDHSYDDTRYDDTNDAYVSDYDHVSDDAALDGCPPTTDAQSPVSYSFDSLTSSAPITSSATEPNQTIATSTDTTVPSATLSSTQRYHNDDGLKKVAPFDLQGGRYGDWVILVDIQALNSDSQKLWDNITQSLSITCETTSFPICVGMDTAELANASLAGYVFKIGRSDAIRVAALTALPEALHHPNLTAVPTLNDMLEDSNAKRLLWKQISD